MSDYCRKHGPYSVFCLECDYEMLKQEAQRSPIDKSRKKKPGVVVDVTYEFDISLHFELAGHKDDVTDETVRRVREKIIASAGHIVETEFGMTITNS